MIISLIHPSRGRADKAKRTFDHWLNNASGEHEIDYVLSLDNSDYTAPRYFYLFKMGINIIQNDNTCVVQAANHAAYKSRGRVIIYVSDDFECPLFWDKTIVEIFADKTEPLLLKVSDGVTKHHLRNETGTENILTIPIMNRALYERLGYFFHPDYRSMYCDEDLFNVVKNNNWLLRREDIIFPHLHWVNKQRVKDETDRRSEANWQHGKETFEQRKLLNFPI